MDPGRHFGFVGRWVALMMTDAIVIGATIK
jgi:hypothetical protein